MGGWVVPSKGFCICPRAKNPRLPPCLALLQSLSTYSIQVGGKRGRRGLMSMHRPTHPPNHPLAKSIRRRSPIHPPTHPSTHSPWPGPQRSFASSRPRRPRFAPATLWGGWVGGWERDVPATSWVASSGVQVMTSWRQEEGRREPWCFLRRWRTWTCEMGGWVGG